MGVFYVAVLPQFIPQARRPLDRITGTVIGVFGIRLALSS